MEEKLSLRISFDHNRNDSNKDPRSRFPSFYSIQIPDSLTPYLRFKMHHYVASRLRHLNHHGYMYYYLMNEAPTRSVHGECFQFRSCIGSLPGGVFVPILGRSNGGYRVKSNCSKNPEPDLPAHYANIVFRKSPASPLAGTGTSMCVGWVTARGRMETVWSRRIGRPQCRRNKRIFGITGASRFTLGFHSNLK